MGFRKKVAKFWGCSSVGRGKLLYSAADLSKGLESLSAKFWGCSSVGRGKLLYSAAGLSKGLESLSAKFWGCSSVGRAPALQAGGRQFESDQLHQNNRKGG